MAKPWFGVKRFGLGVSPASAEGWIALAVYVLALGATALIVDSLHLPTWLIWIGLAIETAILLGLIAVKTDGKPWRWRSGD